MRVSTSNSGWMYIGRLASIALRTSSATPE
jgi:hypothetical protein